jgi:hypothetical protein
VIPWVVPLIWNTNAALSRSIAQAGPTITVRQYPLDAPLAGWKIRCRNFRQLVSFAYKLGGLPIKHTFYGLKY